MNSSPKWPALVLGVCMGFPSSLTAIELDQLFLPQTYLRFLPRLYDAAQLMEESERCQRFIKGELQTDRSTPNHPIFRLTCRDAELKTYALLVDGLSLDVLDSTRPEGSVSFAVLQEELEEQRTRDRQLQERLEHIRQQLGGVQQEIDPEQMDDDQRRLYELWERKENLRRSGLWQICRNHVAHEVRNMIAVEWLSQQMTGPTSVEGELLRFDIDFDARDLSGQHLRYRAQCLIAAENDYSVRIRPRSLVEAEMQPED